VAQERLQKIISAAGIASRRRAEELIFLGRVSVNGQVVTKMGTQADIEKDEILVDGKPVKPVSKKVYYLFYKPENMIVTHRDPQGRPTIYDYLKIPQRVNSVGRLDFDSEGLLLLTNDGDLQAKLTHPSHEIPKTYHVKVAGHPTPQELETLAKGVDIGDYVTRPAQVKVIKKNPHNSWIEIVIHEGKNRQVRRMVEGIYREVLKLIRVQIGSLTLGDLKKGDWRPLTVKELAALKKS
jgi:pseudouridine synthase